jgi:hypothetical protein
LLASAFDLAVVIAAEPSAPSTISVEDLASRKVTVIGHLGVPLGTLVEVEATIVGRGESKMSANSYRLRVESVNRGVLPNPPEMRFGTRGVASRATLPATTSELAEQQTGKPSQWTDEDLEKWERDFVGSRHTLLAYEEAFFAGIPRNPDGFPTISYAGYGFHFSTLLVVVDEFPRAALETPGSAETVEVSAAGRVPSVGRDAETEHRWLVETFLRGPQIFRYAHLRMADHAQDLERYRTALVTKAREQGRDGDALERCIESALARNLPDGALAIPIAAVLAEREGESVWFVTWAYGPMSEGDAGVTASSRMSEVAGQWWGRLRSVAVQGYRMRDGVACTVAASTEH